MKTLGQINYEAMFPSKHSDWDECTVQDFWETAAKAVATTVRTATIEEMREGLRHKCGDRRLRVCCCYPLSCIGGEMKRVTSWFEAIPWDPVRVGFYECRNAPGELTQMRYWNGVSWCGLDYKPNQFGRLFITNQWRGLAENPLALEKP